MKITIGIEEGDSPEFVAMFAKALETLQPRNATERQEPYTVQEAAKLLGVSYQTIYERMNTGIIKSVPGIGRKLIPAPEMRRLLCLD